MNDFERYLGVGWSANGGNIRDGFNCWSFVHHLYFDKLGIDLPSVEFDAKRLKSGINAIAKGVASWSQSEAKQFSVALMARRIEPCHVGMYIDDYNIIHCIKGSGVIITPDYRLEEQGFTLTGAYAWRR